LKGPSLRNRSLWFESHPQEEEKNHKKSQVYQVFTSVFLRASAGFFLKKKKSKNLLVILNEHCVITLPA
jgi:hypothetical protein